MTAAVDTGADDTRDDDRDVTARQARADEPWRWAWTVALPTGIGGALIGLLPWLLGGARLPPQVLWAQVVRPESMPIALLPFSFVTVILIFSLLIVGAAAAGIGGRTLRVRGWGLVLLVLGVLLVQVGAAAQTHGAMRPGLQDRLESDVYLLALVAGTALSILVGLMVTILVASAPRAGALIGLTIGAIGMGSWFSTLIAPNLMGQDPPTAMLVIVPWVAPVLTGIAIAWTGIGTAGRVIAALFALVLVWVAPAVTTALSTALSNQVLIRSSSDVIDYGVQVFRAALLTPELALRPIVATAVVAGVGLGVRALIGRARRPRAASVDEG
ncbi:MAG: hypothetical protein ACXWZG_00735 [Microbacterium sp.]